MKTESKPTSSARHAKSTSGPGANCSAEALYPSLINAAPRHAALASAFSSHHRSTWRLAVSIFVNSPARERVDYFADEDGFCFGNVKRGGDRRLPEHWAHSSATLKGFG